jgi:hypothetical protein
MTKRSTEDKVRAVEAQLKLRGCDGDCVHSMGVVLRNHERRIAALEDILERRKEVQKVK